MADVELIIKIPKEMYNWVYDANKCSNDYGMGDFIDLIKNGTPLPKGHGDLVDRGTYCSALEEKIKNWDVTSEEVHDKIHGIAIAHNICNKLIPIVKADKAESED